MAALPFMVDLAAALLHFVHKIQKMRTKTKAALAITLSMLCTTLSACTDSSK